jgi:Family of unknown function (DUF6499)
MKTKAALRILKGERVMIDNRLNGHLPAITAYDGIQTLPKCDIAWEFLRRNADYGRDVERFGTDAITRDRDWHGIAVHRQVRTCETAARWGLVGLCAPDKAAPIQDLFWLTDDAGMSPSVLTVPAMAGLQKPSFVSSRVS